ncbi:tRNA uridine-5-carboxymethylaminomethyl(34) synthesis GTPase MnmE [Flavobacteriaceae bacterium]|nr:tRNA uridine-5-carboxymethylaminomethyl(34) synthesis GTPase MnmE [Flavobacteriaceae bacterium]
MNHQDTIIALATAPGSGAIAVIRLSGPEAISLASDALHLLSGKVFKNQPSHTVHLADLKQGERMIDQVLATIFIGPKSYTGDDVVELSCHGSPFIQQQIIKYFVDAGARMAQPGEFTLRAFLNGKMDLSQAEAVADLIASDSAAAHELALNQMRGGFSHAIECLRQELLHFASMIELELDFAEEDVAFADRGEFIQLVQKITQELKLLIDSFNLGQVIKDGVPVAIVGAPNVGKSTLLNALVNEERALVSDIAGTTRDTVEDELRLGGVLFRLIDTAGIRDTSDVVEGMGIERTYKTMDTAKVVIRLWSSDTELETISKDWDALQQSHSDKKCIGIVNKTDLLQAKQLAQLTETHPELLQMSAKNKEGVEQLKTALLDLVDTGALSGQSAVVSNSRHYHALVRALEALDKVQEGIDAELSGDLLAIDLRAALFALGEITGAITNDDMLGHIFANFCIGK